MTDSNREECNVESNELFGCLMRRREATKRTDVCTTTVFDVLCNIPNAVGVEVVLM